MKKITYTMKLLSSLIVSPRSGQALYKEIDEFCLSPYVKIPDTKDDEKHEVRVVYPFYQYGEYERYDPEHANYYLPGSSVKGALLQHKRKGFKQTMCRFRIYQLFFAVFGKPNILMTSGRQDLPCFLIM